MERLAGEIKRARAASGMSLAEIGQATLAATDGTYGKWYHRGGHMFFETGRSLPSRPEWEQLRHVLPIAPEFVEVYDEAEREITGHHEAGNPIGVYEFKHGEGKGRTATSDETPPPPPPPNAGRAGARRSSPHMSQSYALGNRSMRYHWTGGWWQTFTTP